MPKKKRPDETPEEQFRRFMEAAKERGVDEKKAEREFKKLSSAPETKREGKSRD